MRRVAQGLAKALVLIVVGLAATWAVGEAMEQSEDGMEDKVLVPHLVFKMYAGKGGNGPVPSSLSPEAAIALWDNISSTIRLRPGAPAKPGAPQPAPAATRAADDNAGQHAPSSPAREA